MQHRGEIVEKAVRQSGFPIAVIARKIKKSRRWMYLMFGNPQIDLDTILRIGKAIHHDFSGEIKELKTVNTSAFDDPQEPYKDPSQDYWKNKYMKLLEDYNELLKKVNGE